MKFSLACLAAAAVADGDRKFSNDDKFMASSPPDWWNNYTPAQRHEFLSKNNDLIFAAYLPNKGTKKLKPLFADLIEDMVRIEGSCAPGQRRKRRSADDDDEDPMAGGERKSFMKDSVKETIEVYTKNVARWVKYMVYDQGGECGFLGERMVSFSVVCISFNLYLDQTYRPSPLVHDVRLLQAN